MAMLRADIPQRPMIYIRCVVCRKRGLCELFPGINQPLCSECAADLSPVLGGKRRGGLRHRWKKRAIVRAIQRHRNEAEQTTRQ